MLCQPTRPAADSPRKRPSEWRCFRPTRSACFRTMESMAFNCFSSFPGFAFTWPGHASLGPQPRRSSLLRILATPPHQALPSVHPGGGVLIAGALRPEYGPRPQRSLRIGRFIRLRHDPSTDRRCRRLGAPPSESHGRGQQSRQGPFGRLRSKSNSTCCISLVAHKATLELEPSSPSRGQRPSPGGPLAWCCSKSLLCFGCWQVRPIGCLGRLGR